MSTTGASHDDEHLFAQSAKKHAAFRVRVRIAAILFAAISILVVPSFSTAAGFNPAAFLEGMAQQAEIEKQRELQRRQIEAQQAQERERAQQRYELEQQRLQLQRQQQELDRMKLQQQSEQLRQQRAQEQRRLAEEQARRDAEEAKRTAIATGSGFFVTPDGYIVTNYHVIEDKSTFAVRDIKGDFYRASVVQRDPANDLALLKIDGRFPALRVGNSDSAAKGQRVLAVGYPHVTVQGNESKVTDGIINSLSGYKGEATSFQISVPVQSGNSGGPLVSESGTVYGVVVAKLSAASGDLLQNVSYAIKSKVLLDFLATAGIKNKPTLPAKANIAAVDSATVLIVARNGALDFSYQTSPAERAAEAKARQEAAAAERIRQDVEAQRARDAAAAARARPPVVAQPSVGRYVPSLSGEEVTDTQTGLIWRRCAEGMAWNGNACVGTPVGYSHSKALEHAVREAGRTGKAWRVPSDTELRSIVLRSQGTAVDVSAFPSNPFDWFWAISSRAKNSDEPYAIYFGPDTPSSYLLTGSYSLRLVYKPDQTTERQPHSTAAKAPTGRYQLSASGDEVTDTKTGLIWRRCAEGMTWNGSACVGTYGTYMFEGAQQHAAREARRTGKAWRVPSKEELLGIVDKTQRPSIDPVAFLAMPVFWYWSSTPVAGDSGDAWVINFYSGYVGYYSRNNYDAVRLVRSGQ